MPQFPEIDIEIIFRSPEEGGRYSIDVLHTSGYYRPHLVVGDPSQRHATYTYGLRQITNTYGKIGNEKYLGVQFIPSAVPFRFGEPRRITVQLIYEVVDYSELIPGAKFTVREGASIVAHGAVLPPKLAV